MTNGDRLSTNGNNIGNFTDESERSQPNTEATTTTPSNNELSRLLTGILIGATLGGLASILSSKNSIDRINRNVQNLGNFVDKTATGINKTVKDMGKAVQSVAVVVNDTFQDVELIVKNTAEDVNETIKTTADCVKNTAESVNQTVKTTADVINTVKQPIDNMGSNPTNPTASNSEDRTLYKQIPIK